MQTSYTPTHLTPADLAEILPDDQVYGAHRDWDRGLVSPYYWAKFLRDYANGKATLAQTIYVVRNQAHLGTHLVTKWRGDSPEAYLAKGYTAPWMPARALLTKTNNVTRAGAMVTAKVLGEVAKGHLTPEDGAALLGMLWAMDLEITRAMAQVEADQCPDLAVEGAKMGLAYMMGKWHQEAMALVEEACQSPEAMVAVEACQALATKCVCPA